MAKLQHSTFYRNFKNSQPLSERGNNFFDLLPEDNMFDYFDILGLQHFSIEKDLQQNTRAC